MKVFITKYALTAGIEVREVEQDPVFAHMVTTPGNFRQSFFVEGKDWHRTWESALARAEVMRRAKIVSLEKSLTRMREKPFTRPEEI